PGFAKATGRGIAFRAASGRRCTRWPEWDGESPHLAASVERRVRRLVGAGRRVRWVAGPSVGSGRSSQQAAPGGEMGTVESGGRRSAAGTLVRRERKYKRRSRRSPRKALAQFATLLVDARPQAFPALCFL